MAILGSGRPLHEAVLEQKRRTVEEAFQQACEASPEIDPHRRIRTETFLLQRTRRVAKAIDRLVEILARLVVHKDALSWRLRGPVGPLALARALKAAAQSPGEACFLLTEIVLAMRRVNVAKIAVGITEEEVRGEMNSVRGEIEGLVRDALQANGTVPPALKEYVSTALDEARG